MILGQLHNPTDTAQIDDTAPKSPISDVLCAFFQQAQEDDAHEELGGDVDAKMVGPLLVGLIVEEGLAEGMRGAGGIGRGKEERGGADLTCAGEGMINRVRE